MKKKSSFIYNNKNLSDMDSEELLDAVEGIWNNKNTEIQGLQKQVEVLQAMLKSPIPLHSLWRAFADNVFAVFMMVFIVWLFTETAIKANGLN